MKYPSPPAKRTERNTQRYLTKLVQTAIEPGNETISDNAEDVVIAGGNDLLRTFTIPHPTSIPCASCLPCSSKKPN